MRAESNFQVHCSEALYSGNLWDHQREEAEDHSWEPGWILGWDPRVGKTRTIHVEARRWFDEGSIRSILVVAPRTVCSSVWGPETRAAYPTTEGKGLVRVVNLYSGPIIDRKALVRQLAWRKRNTPEFVIAIVNRDVLSKLRKELLDWGPEVLVLDELHDYKTPGSARHKAARALGDKAVLRRGLTGSLTPKDYGDFYGQLRIIDKRVFGTDQATFRERYLVCDPRYPDKVLGYRNTKELREKAFSIISVKRRKDCFDIPQVQEITRRIALPPEAKRIYKQIADNHTLENSNGKLLSVDHALSRLTVLQQLAGGYLPASALKEHEPAWIHDAKLDDALGEAQDILDDGKRVVIFHRFLVEGAKLAEKFGNISARLYGGTSDKERVRIIDAFNEPDDGESWPRVLIVQEDVGSVGISLKGADFCIFYSSGFDYMKHMQARDRIFKPKIDEGDTLVYIYLQAIGTVDAWVRNLLRKKQAVSEAILSGTSFAQAAFGDEDDDD